MATRKQKTAPEVKLPRDLAEYSPWDGWMDRAYAESLTEHDSSSLNYCALVAWKKARTEAGAIEHPLLDTGVLRREAAEYLELKGYDRESWYE